MDGSETPISYQNESSSNASNSTTTTANAMGTIDAQRPLYTVPGILHYLQHEWTRFEIERQQWETERAELQARIAFLQGERQGQENLKTALVRRIKMLEYALKQERLKFNKLKYGSETVPSDDPKGSSNEGVMTKTAFDEDENKDESGLTFGGSSVTFKQGRQLLRQYLKEIGYVDTIIDIRSNAVKKLLGIKSESNSTSGVNGETKRNIPNILKNASNDFDKSLASLAFLKDDQIDDDVNEDDLDPNRIMIKSNHNSTTTNNNNHNHQSNLPMESLNDLDSEEAALHEFDFLSGDAANEQKTSTQSEHSNNNEWGMDSNRINRLKEEYKRDRHSKQVHQTATITNSNSAAIRNSLLNNGGNDEMTSDQLDSMMFPNGKNFIGENPMDSLGDLVRVKITNEDENQYETNNSDPSDFRKTWNVKFILRSHLDGVRCVTFHPVESMVITGSEDRTLKLWNLDKAAILRKSTTTTTQDLEPIYTFRRHTGPVLCVAMNSSGEQFYSGGLDSSIVVWNLPNAEVDPYDPYDSSVLYKTLDGHTDAVWQLAICGQKLLSSSSDGTVRLWDPNLSHPLQSTYHHEGIPISIDWLNQDTNQFVVTFDSLKTVIFDTETTKILREIPVDSSVQIDSNYRINRILSHPSQPLIITGHDDRHIRYFDNQSGQMIHSMVAHLDAVTSLAIDPQQTSLLSGSHDRSIRLWNIENKNCLQELTSHQKKDDESIHDIAFHPSKPFMASVGADSIAKIYA